MRPFKIEISDEQLADLRSRIAATRWPATDPGPGWERGVPQAYLRELAGYWQTQYDWRAAEAELNQHPQFVTQIQGTDVHFLHVQSPEPNARPLLLTHGWPSSVVEFLDVIGPLTNPRAHGGDPADAFHLVIPSLPGHGFSGADIEPGWDIPRIAFAWKELMAQLGYDSYLTGGGDWGSIISLVLTQIDAEHAQGAYVAMLLTTPSGDPAEMGTLTPPDFARLEKFANYDQNLSAYLKLQVTKPLTVSYALTDSPVGQLAWIAQLFADLSDIEKTPEDSVDRDRLLTNVSVYWLTGTAASSANLYHESAQLLAAAFTPGAKPQQLPVPLGVAAMTQDAVTPIRAFAERDFGPIAHWTEFERGGHWPALEQPGLFVADIRTFARSLG